MTEPFRETDLIAGVEKRRIEIVDHDPGWPELFRRHERVLREALGKLNRSLLGSEPVRTGRNEPVEA